MRVPMYPPVPPSHIHAAPATTASADDEQASATITLLWAGLLIPGRGEPVHNGAVAIRGGTIEWVGTIAERPSEYRGVSPTYVSVLMPGLWDVHVHYMGLDVAAGISGLQAFLPGSSALIGAVTVDDLRCTLMAGYTSVRELGGYAGDLWPAVKDGPLVGPNIYSAIGILSQTGGHGDDHNAPLTTIKEAMYHGGQTTTVCDGVDECVKTVRSMIRRGARAIKVCSSGGVLSLNDDPEDRQFSDEELRAIVQEAGRSRRAVAAHAIGKAGIMAALRAGVQSIEHGMYLDDEVADAMLAAGAVFVGTQHIVRTIVADYLDQLPAPSRRKVLGLVEQSKKSYRLAVRRGVKIALGTDMVSSSRASRLSHGNNARELEYAVELGMTPLQAIESATANAPQVLGGMAPLSGQIRAGYDADIIAVKSSPLEDVSVLADAKNITHVWKGGKLFKSPSVYEWGQATPEDVYS